MSPVRVLVVVAEATDTIENRRLLRLVGALADPDDTDVAVVVWLTGRLARSFGRVAPTVDVGRVHRRPVPRLLLAVGLGRIGRGLKDRGVRRRLDHLAPPDVLYLGGLGAEAALGWLPRPAAVVAHVQAGDPVRPPEDVDLVVVSDPAVAEVVDGEVARYGLLTPPAPALDLALEPGGIGLVGWTAEELPVVVAALGDRAVWFAFEDESRRSWPLWQGTDAAPLVGRVAVRSPDTLAAAVPALTALVCGPGAAVDDDVVERARLAGTPIVSAPGEVDAAVAARQDTGWVLTAPEAVADLVHRFPRG